jgi:hypothetical protein
MEGEDDHLQDQQVPDDQEVDQQRRRQRDQEGPRRLGRDRCHKTYLACNLAFSVCFFHPSDNFTIIL